tara:strand:+ start:74 stop:178 length:105 start_codon:yes stop_codon:yes gene_type:complete
MPLLIRGVPMNNNYFGYIKKLKELKLKEQKIIQI